MEERHKKILQSSFVYVTSNIHNVEDICDHLEADDVLTTGMVDTIKHKSPKPKAQVRELMSTLPRRGKKAFEAFIHALEKSSNQDVADCLRSKEGSHGKKGDNIKKQDEKLEKQKELLQKIFEDWPSSKGISIVQKKEIQTATEEYLTKISESRKVYHMTGKNKGKVILLSNVSGEDACRSGLDCESGMSTDDCIAHCRSRVDFDESSIQQLFKHMKFKSKRPLKDKSGEEMKTSLKAELEVDGEYDSAVIVIMSGGMNYEPGKIYDKNCEEVCTEDILQIIRNAEVFKGKPKIVIIRTYRFEESTESTQSFDTLDAAKTSSILKNNPNNDDMFVVSSFPKTKLGPWVAGQNGSYFIQALIHVFKNLAHEKSFLQLMEEVNERLHNALVPDPVGGQKYNKMDVADVVVLEHSVDKDLYLFPCLCDIKEISVKAQVEETVSTPEKETEVKADKSPEVKAEKSPVMSTEWPDLKRAGCNFRKKDLAKSDIKIFKQILSKGKEIYSMIKKTKGKLILISNVSCPKVCYPPGREETDEEKRENERRSRCQHNIDFDNTNITMVLKEMGWKTTPQIKNKTREEIIESLTKQLEDIDKDKDADYDSLVVVILSGKIDCTAAKIYDKDGEVVSREKIQQIIKKCQHFKEKPKIVFIQTYNFQEVSPYDEIDTASNEVKKLADPNSDDLFVVSSYPKIEQGPWMIGESMSGSYFIQALIYILTYQAYNKSFLELMNELQKCLVNAVKPEMTEDGKNKVKGEGKNACIVMTKKHVADVVLLEHSKQKELYLLPGFEHEKNPKLGNVDLGSSLTGLPVCQPSD